VLEVEETSDKELGKPEGESDVEEISWDGLIIESDDKGLMHDSN
jgi:hypothetical protein